MTVVYATIAIIIGWLKQTLDLLIVSEVKAREQAENGRLRLESVLEQLPVGVMLADAKSDTVQVNKHLESILGEKMTPSVPAKENSATVVNRQINKSLLPSNWPITRALKHGEQVFAEELEIIKSHKKHIFLRVNATPIVNSAHQIIAAVSTLYDVTAEKEQEKRKDDFINMASHELKTPVTSMKLYLELLERRLEKKQDTTSLATLAKIQHQTSKLQELIGDLLDVSRIQTGKLLFKKEKFNLTTAVQETIEMLEDMSKGRHIIFSTKKKYPVLADRFRIYQVLTNLITNAIKYSPDDSKILIKISQPSSDLQVSVQDFGIGIAKDQLKKVFGRLYQVSDPTEKTFPGLGMGLYISKEIITRHKGKIWVESEKGKGSTFFFTLPQDSH